MYSLFFWYDFLNDGKSSINDEQNFGLIRQPDAAGRYTPKPSYAAYATLIRKISQASFVGDEPLSGDLYDKRFTNNIRVLWAKGTTGTVTVTTGDVITVTTMTGTSQTYTPSNGQVQLQLSDDPIYLEGSAIATVTG